MEHPASELARRLAENAEAVCRHYLSNGVKCGRWWSVGDVDNTPGASLFVRLVGPLSGPNRAGKWTDSATGEHGDLLDLIALNQGCRNLGEAMAEARGFLGGGPSPPTPTRPSQQAPPSYLGRAQRLFQAARPLADTLAERYLCRRGITAMSFASLRFHPAAFYRAHDGAPLQRLPALLAAVTDLDAKIVAVHRTWLDAGTAGIADVPEPKRALGTFLGAAVRFGSAREALVAGEGIETVLSLKSACPELPMAAGLSANHLAALVLPATLTRLWIARDVGAAGERAAAILAARALDQCIEVRTLAPRRDDFNTDLGDLGQAAFVRRVRHLLADELSRIGVST